MPNINGLIEDLKSFSSHQPDATKNTANRTFFDNTSNSFYFSTDFGFNKSIQFIEDLKPQEIKDKIRVALLVGESNFLSLLPELQKHVDLVIMVDIDQKVLTTVKYLHRLMAENKTCRDFAENFSDERTNVLTVNNWKQTVTHVENNTYTQQEIPITKQIALKMLVDNCESIGEKHYIETDQRYAVCRASLKKLNFSFLNFDLLNHIAIEEFKKILKQNNAVLTVMNVNNLLDYDGNFALRNRDKCSTDWCTNGILYKSLKILTSDQPDPVILFSHFDRSRNYMTLTSSQARSVDEYISITQEFIKELNKFARGKTSIASLTKGIYASVFKNIKMTVDEQKSIKKQIASITA